MGWGIEVNGLYLSRVRKDDLPNKLQENNDLIQMYRDELIALAAYQGATYNDGESECSIIDHAVRRVPEILEGLQEAYCQNMMIQHLIDNPTEGVADE